MSISAKDVKELREKTGCGMMDCKKALTEAGGDIEKAAEILREKGLASAVKKAGRIAAEGVVAAYKEGDVAVLLEVNCETDFVAKTEQFKSLVSDIAKIIVKEAPADVDALMAAPCEAGTVEDMMKNAVATIGENMKIRRFARVEGFTDTYIHLGGKIGVLVQTDVEPDAAAIHDVAMQIAAARPTYISKEDVDANEIAHEKEILRAKTRVHDEIGRALLQTRQFLSGAQGDAETVCAAWRQNVRLLLGKYTDEPRAGAFEALARAAQVIGVTIQRDGAFPAEGTENAQLVEAAAHECLTNLVRHAHGTRLEMTGRKIASGWKICYLNDGDAPSGPIIEGSGLAALRARTEAAGGAMEIAHAPRFQLTLVLPRERQEST